MAFFSSLGELGLLSAILVHHMQCLLITQQRLASFPLKLDGLLSIHIYILQYYLKAEFHFNKNQFADLMIINGIAGIISQVRLVNIAFSRYCR